MEVRMENLLMDIEAYSRVRSSILPKMSLKWIYYSKVESGGSCRFQIHLCIPACVMSLEFTHQAVMKFLPVQFPSIDIKCLWSNFIHLKISNLTKYREVLVKYSLLLNYACSHADLNLTLVMGVTNWFIFPIINLLIDTWGCCLTSLDCKGL